VLDTSAIGKILKLEKSKGCKNIAVIGGLDRYIDNWYENQIKQVSDQKLRRRLKTCCERKNSYADMFPSEREKWIENILEYLRNINDSSIEKQKTTSLKNETSAKNKVPVEKRKQYKPLIKNDKSKYLESSILLVKGISEAQQKNFLKLGVATIRDLLYFFPHRHLDYTQRSLIKDIRPGQEHTVAGNVWESREVKLGQRRSAEAVIGDETGNIRIVWFNQPYLAKSVKPGSRVIVSGRVSVFNNMPVFESPEWEPYDEKDLVHTGRFVPVYPLTQGLSQRQVRRLMKQAIDTWVKQVEEFLPDSIIDRLKLTGIQKAIMQAHYPEDETAKDQARKRLAFDELFILQLGVLNKKRIWQESQPGNPLKVNNGEVKKLIEALPFKLTEGQSRSLREILNDMSKPKPMSRLLQGDVGSGKTVVAAAAMIAAVVNGFQAAIMAPTEILAEQHFKTIRKTLSLVAEESGEDHVYSFKGYLKKDLRVALLTGYLSQSKKQIIYQKIRDHQVDIIIGTHALIQKAVDYAKLGLVVVDEQHRFGVEQRSELRKKGANPHLLVMTATPIPRTLSLTLYGDLDLSVITEMPPGRQVIKTRWVKPEQRMAAYKFIRQQIEQGRQAFIICPLVEESEAIQARAAVAEYEHLAGEIFHDYKIGLLHGRMSSNEKEAVMKQFSSGDINILVSTPVVEVGIDVPNATVMLIESADRFGLSQLHQFRGRVGRGTEQSYCMLMAEKVSDVGKERLDIIEKVHNGFELAEEDLKLRGPGEFFGTRQSGIPDLKMARLSDVTILETARREAEKIFSVDPDLSSTKHVVLRQEMERIWGENITEFNGN
jgi:ATP-dependent DNA helicase RecG